MHFPDSRACQGRSWNNNVRGEPAATTDAFVAYSWLLPATLRLAVSSLRQDTEIQVAILLKWPLLSTPGIMYLWYVC